MELKSHIVKAFENAEKKMSHLCSEILEMDGMTGKMTRHFYNNLLDMEDARYLEIGTWKGSSVCSAMYKNRAKIVCVDNWSEFAGPKSEFLANLEKYKGDNDAVFIEKDSFSIDVSSLPRFNIFMYDGNHSKESHYRALFYFYDCLDDIFIYIVDDWNWEIVRESTMRSIKDLGLHILYQKEIRLTDDDNSTTHCRETWWNGIFVVLLQKTQRDPLS